MDLRLKDKRALVLGSTRGIGRGIAEALAAEGAAVAVCGRDKAAAENTAREIGAQRSYGVDLMEAASVAALIDAVSADWGGVDVLVNNGGGPPPGPVTNVNGDLWKKQFQAMFLSLVEITNAFLPGMRERGWGRVLINSSSGAVQPIPGLGMSNTLRGSLLGWAKTLAGEIAADGVTINTIMPGRIHTDRVNEIDAAAAERQGKTVEEVVAASLATIPAGRYGTAEEYGAVAAFLVSEQAAYITGSVTRVDGGYIRAV